MHYQLPIEINETSVYLLHTPYILMAVILIVISMQFTVSSKCTEECLLLPLKPLSAIPNSQFPIWHPQLKENEKHEKESCSAMFSCMKIILPSRLSMRFQLSEDYIHLLPCYLNKRSNNDKCSKVRNLSQCLRDAALY